MDLSKREFQSARSRWKLPLGLLLGISIAFNLFLGGKVVTLRSAVAKGTRDAQLEVGAVVPPINVRTIDGLATQIKYGAGDVPTVLYFFSPGCDTCERNVPNIKRLADTKRSEYRVIGLSLSEESVEEYAKNHDLNFPVYTGLGVETTLVYKLGRVPQTTVISADGRILANWYGPYDGKLRPTIESFFQFSY
jgi:peroxiredoxin